MREGSTSFGADEVRCWRGFFGNKTPVLVPQTDQQHGKFESCGEDRRLDFQTNSGMPCSTSSLHSTRRPYTGTSLIRNRNLLGPYSRTLLMVLWGEAFSYERGTPVLPDASAPVIWVRTLDGPAWCLKSCPEVGLSRVRTQK